MLKTTRRLWWTGYWLCAVLISLFAMLVLLLRLLLPQVTQYRADVEQLLSEQLTATVEIAQLEGEWQGAYPTLRLQGLSVKQAGTGHFSLQRAEVGINLAESLLQWRPVFTRLQFIHPDITLIRSTPDPASTEAPSKASTDTALAVPLWLLDQPLEISEGVVSVEQADGGQLQLKGVSAGLVAMGSTWQMTVEGQLGSGDEFRSVKTIIEGLGAPQRGKAWLYAEFDGIAPSVLNQYLPESVHLKGTNLKQQLWARLQGGKLQQMQALTDLRSAQLGEQWLLEDSRLLLDLQALPNGYQVQLHGSHLNLNGHRLTLPVVAGNLVQRYGSWWLDRAQAPHISLDTVTAFAITQPLSEEILTIVRELNLRGDLNNLTASWSSPKWLDFSLAADLDQLALDDWAGVPQIEGISGRLEATAKGGKIHLNSQQFTLGFPDLFPEAWRYGQADGVVGWTISEDAATLHSELLHLKQPEIEAHGRFSLRLPFDGGQTELTLMIGTREADGRVAGRYVPPAEVGKATHRWLVGAIKAGAVRQGGFLLNGGTHSQLEGYQLPSVQMFFDVNNAEFAFQPGWPAVKQGDAFMLYKDGALSVDITQGKILDSTLERAWVGLTPAVQRVDVIGELDGDAADIRTLLLDSPLHELVGDELKNWQLKGALKTELAVAIPLEGAEPVVNISSTLSKGQFGSRRYKLNFSDVAGILRYKTPWGLEADTLSAQFFGKPASIKINSGPVAEFGNSARTQIELDSRIDIATLRDWLTLPFLNIAQGETWYRARLNICKTAKPGCSGLDLRSSLQGVEVVGPEVLAKARDEQRYFRLQSDLNQAKEQITLRYGDAIRARLQLKNQTLERGRIAFNRTPVILPPDPGLRVIGSLPELKFERLMPMLERAGLLADTGSASTAPVKGKSVLHSVALNIGRFSLADTVVENLDTLVRPMSRGWNLHVASETFTGSVLFPANGDPYEINIAGLNLNRDVTQAAAIDAAVLDDSPVRADALPRSNVVIQQLKLNDKPMGAWSFALIPDAKGVTIRNIQGQLANVELQGEVRWDEGERDQSALTLKVKGGDLGDVLQQWGHDRALENKELTAYLQLEWSGAPWQFRVGRASGETRFIIKKGRLVETGASSNFLRLFGILNLNSLGRRLRLDFSDLFEKGVAFDRIGGDYRLLNGIARTHKPFEMTGPSVDMKLTGELDLERETLKKQMEVTLPVTANLPVVGVLLGAAPQIAGAVFLIDKLIGDKLEKFTTIRYRVDGPWADPQITLPGGKKVIRNKPAKKP